MQSDCEQLAHMLVIALNVQSGIEAYLSVDEKLSSFETQTLASLSLHGTCHVSTGGLI